MKKLCIAASLLMIGFNAKGQNTLPTSGNVGVGTTTPGSKLQVSGTPSDRVLISNSTINYSTSSPKLSLFGYSTGTEITGPSLQKISTGGYGHGRLAIFQHGGADYTSEKEVMSILPNGNVGIGTIDPKVTFDIASNKFGLPATSGSIPNGFMRIGYTDRTWGGTEILSGIINSHANDYAGYIQAKNPIDYSQNRTFLINPQGGNVGIGTAKPLNALEIGKAFSFHTGGHYVLGFGYASGRADLNTSLYGSELRFDPTNGVFHIGVSSGLTDAPSYRLSVNKEGNVGIGTANPSAKLDVNGIIQAGSNNSTGGGIFLAQKYGGNDYIGTLSSNHSSGALILGYGAAGMKDQGASGQLVSTFDNFSSNRGALRLKKGTLEFLSTPSAVQTTVGNEISVTSRFFIEENGNVGIGTITPDSKLAVNGKIHTKEVKVDLIGWSDFVFYENYDLPTLKEVEDHIKAKGHLKDIPSEKEVVENGIQLGEMNAKLLQKIEELTLYTIQQEKKIQKQEEEINALKDVSKRLEKLEKLLSEKN